MWRYYAGGPNRAAYPTAPGGGEPHPAEADFMGAFPDL